jgi:hypothetical protein
MSANSHCVRAETTAPESPTEPTKSATRDEVENEPAPSDEKIKSAVDEIIKHMEDPLNVRRTPDHWKDFRNSIGCEVRQLVNGKGSVNAIITEDIYMDEETRNKFRDCIETEVSKLKNNR